MISIFMGKTRGLQIVRIQTVWFHYCNGAKLADATVAHAPPLLCPPRKFIVLNGVKIPQNSPPCSAPALLRALLRQWK